MVASEDGAENDISACWDEVEEAADAWSAAKDAFFMGPCPHDWLFQRVAGVVHHGGAGMFCRCSVIYVLHGLMFSRVLVSIIFLQL